jgi:anti-sigma factor RsiW
VLRARIRAALAGAPVDIATSDAAGNDGDTRRAPRRTAWRGPVALAAALVLAAALGSGVTLAAASRQSSDVPAIGAQVLASHVRSLMPNHLTDIASSDQHNVKPWFNGRTDYSPNVPRFEEQGYPLLGGRLDYVGNRAVAVVVYGRRQHIINVFSWPSAGNDETPAASASNGYNVLHWRSRGIEEWVVSDLNAAELGQFAGLLRGGDAR